MGNLQNTFINTFFIQPSMREVTSVYGVMVNHYLAPGTDKTVEDAGKFGASSDDATTRVSSRIVCKV